MLAVGTHGTTASAESAESSECFQRDREATAAGIDAHSDLRPRRLQWRLRLAWFAALPLLQHAQRACFLLRMWLLCRRFDKSAEPALPAEPTTTLLAAALAHPDTTATLPAIAAARPAAVATFQPSAIGHGLCTT